MTNQKKKGVYRNKFEKRSKEERKNKKRVKKRYKKVNIEERLLLWKNEERNLVERDF